MKWYPSKEDLYFFDQGKLADAYRLFGSHLIRDKKGKIIATRFTVYAPNAKAVKLICSYNNFEGWKHELTKIDPYGVWSIEIPENLEWNTYKYEVYTQDGRVLYKADPYAYFSEVRPANASKVYDIEGYEWHDDVWMYTKPKPYDKPVLIYEMHLGSWKRKYGQFIKYNELVEDLIHYLKNNNFTHVEFLPVYEHPLDDSWGYQGTGFFAATSRYGVPKDLMYLIDRLHQAGIGVLIDWVLGHINRDEHGLYFFDGTPLYEIEDDFQRENIVWGTANLDFSKGATKSFMLSALSFWVKYFHIDGFRIDAVSNLYHHHGNPEHGENKPAIDFLKQLSHHLFGLDDRLLFMAEDSSTHPDVTKPVDAGGVGFNYKWNMGFMNDTLNYFKKDPIYRKWHHHNITFGTTYAFSEQFILPYSHDEVVHGKGSMLTKMPGDYFQKFANYRALLTLWMTHPGKKLLFMGQEFAHFAEWNVNRELDWNLLDFPAHNRFNRFFKDLGQVYHYHQEFHKYDHDPKTFEWIDADNTRQSIYSYIRWGKNEHSVIILNLTPNVYHHYEVGVPMEGVYEEILNSDKEEYYGSNQYNGLPLETINDPRHKFRQHIKVTLGPLTGLILKYKGKKRDKNDKLSK